MAKKKKMKTVNKVLVYLAAIATAGQFMGFWLAYVLRSEVLGSVILSASYASIIAALVSYIRHKTQLNTKSMEIDYDPNYDKNNGLY